MSTFDFRAAVSTTLEAWKAANFPTLPLVYENGPQPDKDTIGPIWLDCEIRWYGGTIASVGVNPRTRDSGALSLMCYYKDQEGTALSDQIIDSLGAEFSARRLGRALMQAKQRTVPTHLLGWYKTGILVPFQLG